MLIPTKFEEKEAGLEINPEILGFPYWLRGAAMDEHIVPGFRRLVLRLFELQYISQALTQRRSLKKLIIFVQRRSPPKDSGLQPEKGDERASLKRFVHVLTTCPSLPWLRKGLSNETAVQEQKRSCCTLREVSSLLVESPTSIATEQEAWC